MIRPGRYNYGWSWAVCKAPLPPSNMSSNLPALREMFDLFAGAANRPLSACLTLRLKLPAGRSGGVQDMDTSPPPRLLTATSVQLRLPLMVTVYALALVDMPVGMEPKISGVGTSALHDVWNGRLGTCAFAEQTKGPSDQEQNRQGLGDACHSPLATRHSPVPLMLSSGSLVAVLLTATAVARASK